MEQIKVRLMEELQTPVAFTIPLFGGIPVTLPVVVSWLVMGALILAAALGTRQLKLRDPGKPQLCLEMAVEFLNGFTKNNMGPHGPDFAPYLGTIALYILLCNIIGIFGLVPPTKDLNVTAALAIMSAVLIYGAQFRYHGLRGGLKKFMEPMAKEQQEIKDNYTYLGFAWLKGLSEVRYYDLRNEASKLMADDLCLHVKEQPERVRLVYEGAEEMEINPSDEEQMAKMFTCYLLAGSMDGYGEFVDYALDTHRTLQQNLTRFFVEWFAKAEKGSAFLKRAKMVYSRYSLPYI